MSKPHRIILIRHGQSMANIDSQLFASLPDYTIELTEFGKEQARNAGKQLKEILQEESVYFYISPFWRTRSTFEEMAKAFPREQFQYSEEPRLREQEWGYLRSNEEFNDICEQRKKYGVFYYRIPGGEAATDVYDRIHDLLGTLHRDFSRPNFPRNCVLVTHSLAIRLFIMRWYHLTIEEFEEMCSPEHCEPVVMEYQENGSYRLLYTFEKKHFDYQRQRPIRLAE